MGIARYDEKLRRQICDSVFKHISVLKKSGNMTIAEVCEVLGIGTTVYNNIRTGDIFPAMSTMIDLSNALNLSIEELMGFKERADESEGGRALDLDTLLKHIDNCSDDQIRAVFNYVVSTRVTFSPPAES